MLGSLLLLATRDAEYEATADLLVDPLPLVDETFRGLSLIRDTGDPVRTVQTAASLVESPAIAEDAAEKLGQALDGAERPRERSRSTRSARATSSA